MRKVEPVGSFYERLCKTGRVRTTSVPPSVVNLPIDEEQNDDDFEMEDSSNAEVIPACDPKDWKVIINFFDLICLVEFNI